MAKLTSSTSAASKTPVIVTIERRDDGGLYVYSDDLPGFVLSHRDADAVLADIGPALAVFLSRKFA